MTPLSYMDSVRTGLAEMSDLSHEQKIRSHSPRESELQSPISIIVIVRARNARLFGRRVVLPCWRLHYVCSIVGNEQNCAHFDDGEQDSSEDGTGRRWSRDTIEESGHQGSMAAPYQSDGSLSIGRLLINRAAPLSMATGFINDIARDCWHGTV
ncbi:hypothetical protein C8J56DRAFT_900749 [Mycena floridula]|nr:hypothetical protein C8J56DRAFT_900749 [Mycena floridula]